MNSVDFVFIPQVKISERQKKNTKSKSSNCLSCQFLFNLLFVLVWYPLIDCCGGKYKSSWTVNRFEGKSTKNCTKAKISKSSGEAKLHVAKMLCQAKRARCAITKMRCNWVKHSDVFAGHASPYFGRTSSPFHSPKSKQKSKKYNWKWRSVSP